MGRKKISEDLKNKTISISLPAYQMYWIEKHKHTFNLSKFVQLELGNYINHLETNFQNEIKVKGGKNNE